MRIGSTRGDWVEYANDATESTVLALAGDPILEPAWELSNQLKERFEASKATLKSVLAIVRAEGDDPFLQGIETSLDNISLFSPREILRTWQPARLATRDQEASAEGAIYSPAHQVMLARSITLRGPATVCRALAKVANELARHLERRAKDVQRPSPGKADRRSERSDVLLVTVTEVETRAALAHMTEHAGDPKLDFHGSKTYFRFPKVEGTSVVVVRSEMGSDTVGGATTTVSDAIAHLKPGAVVMVGIAFGVDEEKLPVGSVLVSQQLQGYELQRVGTEEDGDVDVTPRGDKVTASPRLLDRLKTAALTWPGGQVKPGLLLSGSKLIDNLAFRQRLQREFPEAIGGEMEGVGLYAAAAVKNVEWILAKAVCDFADGLKGQEKKQRQELAADAAASFVVYAIRQGGFRSQDEV